MVKKMKLPVILAIALVTLACGYHAPVMPPGGLLFSNIEAPIDTDAESNTVGSLSGSSASHSILGLIAFGDASVKSAARDGGLTTIDHVDYQYFNILFIYQQFKTKVYGE